MNESVSHDTGIVHRPHSALPGYYRDDDAQAREQFLRTTFDDTAVDYDRLERILGLGSGSAYRYRCLRAAGLQPGMDVLDVGMGTGLVASQILRITGEPQRLVGVDPSVGMMKCATLPPQTRCLLGRAEEVPLPDASIDFLAMGYALRHIADFSLACAEFRRVLRPGGRVLILEISKPEGRIAHAVLKAYMRGVVPWIARLTSRSPTTPMLWRYYWDTIEACVPPARVLDTMRASGLRRARRDVELGIFSAYHAVG